MTRRQDVIVACVEDISTLILRTAVPQHDPNIILLKLSSLVSCSGGDSNEGCDCQHVSDAPI